MIADLYQDAELYDAVHAGYRDDLHFYRRLADDHGGPVLELGAGTGRVTAALAAACHAVLAVEPRAEMRARGAARLVRDGCADRVTWIESDMRTLSLGLTVPLAIAPFHTLMHLRTLADQDAALRAVRHHLAPGGTFATDVFVPRFAGLDRVRVESVVDDPSADLLVWQHHDPVAQVIITEMRLDRIAPDGSVGRRRATLRQRYYHRFELERALRSAGFSSVRVFGGFDRGPVTPASTSWAFVARH